MPTARYTIQIDWQADGDTDAADVLDRDVIRAEWSLGLTNPADVQAAPSQAVIVLRDPARRYDPAYASGPLYGLLTPRKLLTIRSTYDGVTRVHFTGWTESITPHADRTVTIRASGVEALLQRSEVFLPLGINQTADAVIAAALAQVAYPPAISGYWQLGVARLGIDTRLPDVTTYADLEPGKTRMAYVGDNWGDGTSAWAVLRAVTATERGLCFVDRAGRVVFWNRHHLPKQTTPAVTLTRDQGVMQPVTQGAALVNHAVITCHPRTVGTGTVALWTLQTPLRIPANGTRTIRARFGDDSGVRIGARSLQSPIAGTDYAANAAPDCSGPDRTGSVIMAVEPAGNSALITFTNTSAQPVVVLAGAQVRGIPLVDRGPVDVTDEDVPGITAYGRRTRQLNLPLLSDPELAAGLARHLVVEGAAPRHVADTITVRGNTAVTLAAILRLTIGDAVAVEGDSGGRYHIVGERHMLQRGGTQHSAAWTVRIAPPLAYWQLGISGAGELGTVTNLAY
jgi:hypothetical protein